MSKNSDENSDERDISSTLDDFLAMVDKDLGNHVKTDSEVSRPAPDRPAPEVSEVPKFRKAPVLVEPTEEPLQVPTSKKVDYSADIPRRLPNLDRVREKSEGGGVIPKKSRTEKMPKGKKSKKKKIVLAIILALGASLVVVATVRLASGPIKHAQAVASYVDNAESLDNFRAEPGEPDLEATDLESVGVDVGKAIVKELEAHSLMRPYDNYDVNKALVKYLAITYDKLVRLSTFTKNGAMTEPKGELHDFLFYRDNNWMNTIYTYVAQQLRDEGVVDLPETLEGYLTVNGFDTGELKYDSVTDKLEYKATLGESSDADEPEFDHRRALDNMRAYGMSLVGREKNPEDAISDEFRAILAKFEIFFTGYDVNADLDGIHVNDKDGNNVYTLKGALEPSDPLAFDPIDVRKIKAK